MDLSREVHSNVEDVPLKFNPSLRAKATSAARNRRRTTKCDGVEILQKVIEENLLEELKRA